MSWLLDEAIADKLDGGMGVAEACETYGLSWHMVHAAYRRSRGRELNQRNTSFTPENVELSRVMWRQGATTREISETLGIKHHTVETYMMRHRDVYPYRHKMRHRYGEDER